MAVVQIPNLPPAIALTGGEQLEAVQAGVSVRITTTQIAFFAQNLPANVAPSGLFCTNRQWRSALAAVASPSPNALVEVDNNVPADISNAINIQWNHGEWVVSGDALYTFTQTVLGYSASQIAVIMADALVYPL
jgi:hypothetical protein